MSLATGLIPIDEVVYFDICTHNPSTGAVSDADATPTFDVYEEATDTGMLGATNFTKRTSLTGDYRGTFTASAANGFETGKWYSVIASATVNAIAAKKNCGSFRVAPAETVAGVPKIDVADWLGSAPNALVAGRLDSYTGAMTAGVIAAGTFAANALDANALATDAVNEIRDAIFARAFSAAYSSLTFDQMIKVIIVACAGICSGMATTTGTFRNLANSADVIVATIDANGNRTGVTVTP